MQAECTLDERTMDKIKLTEAHLMEGRGRLDQFLERLTGKKVQSDDDED
jgi:hypothetical protein